MNESKATFWYSYEHGLIVGFLVGIIFTSVLFTLLMRLVIR